MVMASAAARGQFGAALALMGDHARAERVLASAVTDRSSMPVRFGEDPEEQDDDAR